MEQKKYNFISRVIAKLILFNKISKSEKYDLESWLSQSEENVKTYNNICDSRKYLDWEKESSMINIDDNWVKVYFKTVNKSIVRRKKLIQLSVASAIFIVVGLSLYLFFYSHYNKSFTTSNNLILAGGTKAKLLLDDGSIINLNDMYKSSNTIILDGLIGVDSLSVQYYNKNDNTLGNKYHTILVPRGGEYVIKFDDGSSVHLNSQTKLRFPIKFNDTLREVFLEGEAYFNIKSNKQKPFIVNTNNEKIRVLGTEFNVRSYSDELTSRTTLVLGKVEVITKYGTKKLKPSEQSVLNLSTNTLDVKVVNPIHHTSWVNNYLVFNNQRLETIMKELARWYNFDAVYSDDRLKNIRFGGKINRTESIEAILRIIAATNKVSVKIVGTTIVFRKNNY